MATQATTKTQTDQAKTLDSVPVTEATEGGGVPPPTNSAKDASGETKGRTEDPVGDTVNSGSKNENGNDKEDAPVTDTQKKIKRAERFRMPVQLSEEEKRNSRAERFGTAPGSQGSDATKKAEELKRKARAERFGIPQSTPTDEDEKKKARLARFASASSADPLEEQKKKARALRFSETQASGNGKIQPDAPIAGKAGGEA